ncbi:polysaccharide deacetylase family protein [Pelagibacterales bacterium SAG-MED15]|nr:polysaccharide deacetylase family protein [Pelagibacterales bacterium SAG-MED15]
MLFSNSIAEENNSKYYSNESGVLSLMYHRFNENKYPSTNIKMDIFEKHIQVIKDKNYQFENPEEFKKKFNFPKDEKKILITIDDAFLSFYENAWPFLKKNKIPFILFVSTEPVGKKGYMTWDQIKEVEKEKFAYIGNHSHSHEYLINLSFSEFKNDINKSINIFKSQLGYNPVFYSHPFGEYSQKQIKFLRENFEFAFGQHSGVIDVNKDKYQLPRFPINEKYGDLDRFKFLIDLSPLQFKKINPVDMYLIENNPPNLIVEFFEDQKNIRSINCFSDEGNKWEKSNVVFKNQKLQIIFRDKFLFRRGRVNCSLNDDGWRWFGIQFTVKTD